ncbi:MAG: NTP transferase domain-containing protein [Bacteroidetes bacterium]|nr:NTP transferase domain-containing protein [Bacteroidota bacterium]MCW5894211.1 NTP transferase domain-containing protein [Bacteroidota bacterium]
MKRPLAVIIMAAGKGTRMNNPDMAKVMFPINGKPMVEHVVDLALKLEAQPVVVIVGWQKDSVIKHLKKFTSRKVECVEQNPQQGTGHAVMQAEYSLRNFEGDVLVLSGDVPMMTYETATSLIELHYSTGARATVLTAVLDDATGYGRILRNTDGSVFGIVEHKDATPEQREIREINSGIYVFDAKLLFESLKHITPTNAQKEYYLTDVFHYFWLHQYKVSASVAGNPLETQGINTVAQLEAARELMQSSGS